MAFGDFLSSSAVSLTVAGNTGISPFLTLLLLGLVEKSDPELLNMDGFMEKILSSWGGIAVLSAFTSLEFIGKCIPVVDEIIDSVEVFVVPVISIFGSLGTMGLLNQAKEEASTGERRLFVGDAVLTFWKAVLVVVGVFLAVSIHLFKMLIRLIGLACCAGCCQPCITVVEVTCVLIGVLVSIFIQEIAIAFCIILFLAAGYVLKRKFIDKDIPQQNPPVGTHAAATPNAGNNNMNAAPEAPIPITRDVENPPRQSADNAPSVDPNSPAINPAYIKVDHDDNGHETHGDVVEVTAVPVR